MHPVDIDNPDLTLAEIFERWPEAARVFLKHRTGCFGCLISPFHTVDDACREYGLDEPRLRAELRAIAGRD